MNAMRPVSPATVKTTLGLLPMIALSAALTGPGHAQQQGEIQLDEISVLGAGAGTGEGYRRERIQSNRATAPLVNTPQTVTVVPEQVIEERGATDLVEVLRNTPGISLDAGENAFTAGGNSIFIRGMNATGSIFVDGARDNGSYSRDIFNVEQVEVVKGVASSSGRGGGAGYVNMVTKTPVTRSFIRGSARIGFDDYGNVRSRGSFDVNQTAGDFAARFNGMIEGGGIFGRDIANASSWGIAPSFAYGLDTDLRIILAYEHLERSGVPDSGVNINRPNGFAINTIIGDGGRGPAGTAPRNAFFGDPNGYDNTRSDALLGRIEYDVNDWLTVSNQTRWSHVDRDAHFFVAGTGSSINPPSIGAGGAPNAIRNYFDRVNTTLTNDTNLTARFDTGSLSHTLSAGIEFSHEKADTFRPNWQVAGTVPNSVINRNTSQRSQIQVDTAAAYVYDTVEFNDRWLVNGGLRLENYNVTIRNTNAATGAPINLPNLASGTYTDSRTTLGGQFGVVYKPTQNASVYASYGLSHLPHGSLLSNPDPSRTGDNAFPGFVAGALPVAAHNYEIGAKWDLFGGDLSVTGALFRTEKKNVAYVGAAGDPRIVYGEQIIQGVELGVAGNITAAWNVFGGIVLLNSERRHGPEVDRALAGDYGANGTFFPAVTTTNGNELAFTPNVTASLWSTYRWSNGLTLGGGVQYVGESWIGRPDDALRVIPNGKFGKLPSYFLVNLMAAYEVNDNVTLRFNIDNLFNETYLTTANWNGSWGYLGAPRTYRFGTSFSF